MGRDGGASSAAARDGVAFWHAAFSCPRHPAYYEAKLLSQITAFTQKLQGLVVISSRDLIYTTSPRWISIKKYHELLTQHQGGLPRYL